ncbi:hypothetical protein [Paenibacillus sp. GYB003]|uniref:hypothetical protein n=1 Tax=Paenibacillus sp. GYB003 TaxID=2994392 RepID=UPI002F96A636
MSNIGWDRLRKNPVVADVQPQTEILEHYEGIKIDKDASEGQKEFARRYNAMRKMLIDHGLMEKK